MNRRKSGSVRAWGLCALAVWVALCAPAWAYKQDYLYEDRGSWRNVQIAEDRLGNSLQSNYMMLYDENGVNSLLYAVPANFSGKKADLKNQEPFMVISGRVWGIETRMPGFHIVTSEVERTTYIYYRLAGDKTNLYRKPLRRGYSKEPEVRNFMLEDSPFLFTSFTPAKDPDEFLLASRESSQREVTIGLFSFSNWDVSGTNKPIRQWTCMLPEDRNYTPSANEVGYRVVYEESTENVWLVVRQGYSNIRYSNWFFYAPLSQSGSLQAFDPVTEVPEWNDTHNFKELEIGRYRRTVSFTAERVPNREFTAITVYEAGAGGQMRLAGQVDSWVDSEGSRHPLREFWSREGSGNDYSLGSSVESQNAIYVLHSTQDDEDNQNFVRIARFIPDQIIEDVVPDPVEDGKMQPANAVVLSALPFKGPEGYTVTGSRWEVYQKTIQPQSVPETLSIRSYEGQEPVYIGTNADSSSRHELTQTLPAGDYVWRMIYYWQIGGQGGMKGTTYWSKLGSFTAVGSPTPTPNPEPQPSPGPKPTPKPNPRTDKDKSGGGCDAGLGGLALLLAASWVLKKKA